MQEAQNFVKKLLRKLGDDTASPSWIVTARGPGYRMSGPARPGAIVDRAGQPVCEAPRAMAS